MEDKKSNITVQKLAIPITVMIAIIVTLINIFVYIRGQDQRENTLQIQQTANQIEKYTDMQKEIDELKVRVSLIEVRVTRNDVEITTATTAIIETSKDYVAVRATLDSLIKKLDEIAVDVKEMSKKK